MGKIKLNLASGGVVEKPLITAFKGTNGSYVVLDNEMNGGMGLPIILVCKLENDRLVKINDQAEWGMVKENLKSIIAGGNIEYLKINNELPADDVYFTQLTLPVPSFDTLKNNYKVDEGTQVMETASIFDVNPQVVNENIMANVNTNNPTVENGTPISNIFPQANNINNNETVVNNAMSNSVNTNPFTNVMGNSEVSTPITPSAPAVDIEKDISPIINPITNENNVSPISPIVNEEPKIEVSPVIANTEETPIQGPEPVNMDSSLAKETQTSNLPFGITNDLFKEQKEAFMQACENMFDALVQKFEKELEKNKGN